MLHDFCGLSGIVEHVLDASCLSKVYEGAEEAALAQMHFVLRTLV